jgi:exodeoxyribonuclease VII small subunit
MTESPSFETALEEVERIVRALEDGTTTLEDGLAKYERGVALLKICYGHLRAAEDRISLLAGLDADGKPQLKPFDHVASDGQIDGKVSRPTRSNSGLY